MGYQLYFVTTFPAVEGKVVLPLLAKLPTNGDSLCLAKPCR